MVVAEFVHLSERIFQHDILPKEKADDVLTEWTVGQKQPQIGVSCFRPASLFRRISSH